MLALSVMGNLVQRLRPGVVIVSASEAARRILHLLADYFSSLLISAE